MKQNNDGFSISYSAEEQTEVRRIVEKYSPEKKEKSPLERIKELDSGVDRCAGIWALTIGIIGTLIMGTGMSMALTNLFPALGVLNMVIGSAVGMIGIAICALAYPLYRFIQKRERARVAPEMLKISEEFLKESD